MGDELNLSRVSYVSFLTTLTGNNNNTIDKLLKIGFETSKNIKFHEKIIYTAQKPDCETYDFKVVEIDPMRYGQYTPWVIKNSPDLFESDFVLFFQADGMIRNPSAWTEEFYGYDYIGAPWCPSINGGNGGFSLRSRLLCELARKLDLSEHNFDAGSPTNRILDNHEDVIICRKHENLMKYNGARFAPADLAVKFSTEHWGMTMDDFYDSFGFHEIESLTNPEVKLNRREFVKKILDD